jgi:hypothetical protein
MGSRYIAEGSGGHGEPACQGLAENRICDHLGGLGAGYVILGREGAVCVTVDDAHAGHDFNGLCVGNVFRVSERSACAYDEDAEHQRDGKNHGQSLLEVLHKCSSL